MSQMTMQDGFANIAFYAIALVAILGSLGVALSKNIVRTAFALCAVLFAVAGLYGLMKADFVFAIQVLVYVGGILVLIIFAIMLTHKIVDVRMSNPSMPTPLAIAVSVSILACMLFVLIAHHGSFEDLKMTDKDGKVVSTPVKMADKPMTQAVGEQLLTRYLYPFEILSVLLLAALIGAAYLARKEVGR